jgi:hypothetical protein
MNTIIEIKKRTSPYSIFVMRNFIRAFVLTIIVFSMFVTSALAADAQQADKPSQLNISINIGSDNTLYIETNNKAFWFIPYVIENERILLSASTVKSIINECEGNIVCTVSDLCSYDAPKTILSYKALELEYIADMDFINMSSENDIQSQIKLDCSPIWSRVWNKATENKYFYNNGCMYIPLRATFENLGFTVQWNGTDKSIQIVK